MRNAITRQIADDLDVTTSYQELAYPSDIGAALAHGGQVLLTFKRTSGTNITFKIDESVSDLAGYVAKVEDDGTNLTLIERTSTLATFSYVFTTLAEKVKVYVKGSTGNEVLDVFMTVGEITNIEQAQVPGGGSGGTAGGDVQTAGADGESNTADAQYVASRMYGFNGTTWDRLRTAITSATATITGVLNVIGLGKYSSSNPTLTDGQYHPTRVNVNGAALVSLFDLLGGEDLTNGVLGVVNKPISASTYSLSRSAVFASDVDVSAKAAPGNIYSAHAHNINAALRYLHIFNKASAPAGSDVPVFSFSIPAGSATQPGDRLVGTDFFGTGGYYLSTGIAYGVSTVNATFTAATTTDHNEHVMYI